MKFALFLVLSLSAVALAGPAFTKNNQIQQQQDAYNKQQQQQQYMTSNVNAGEEAKSQAVQILKQWCFASQMSQQELTASFKKLVSVVKSNPIDQITESAVMGERICQGALVAKSQQTGEIISQGSADAKAHELIKDVYMDAMISCKSHECTQQLLKTIESDKIDSIRASYYMTRIAVTDKQEIKDEQEIKQLAESFLVKQSHQSEAVERQQLFATTSLIGKWISQKQQQQQQTGERSQVHQVAEQVIKAIAERYIKPVSQQQVEQYQQTEQGELSPELAKKIAKRSAALKAISNIPGHVVKSCPEVEEILVELAQNKKELSTVRQSAIECLEQNEKQIELLKELTFAEEEPIEVRVAAYRALMTSMWSADNQEQQQQKQQKQQKQAEQVVAEIIKHCEQKQQQDEQFVLYAVSHLDNVRTSQQPEVQAIKSTISENKQHFMQIQLLAKKLKHQLSDVRRSSRNYKLEQEFSQLESGLVLEGDIIYESQQKKQQQQQMNEILPKLVRVNMSMPVMGETVNVIEITLRQDNMDQELLGALKLVQNTKFNQQTVSKVVDSFKQTAERQQQQQQSGKQTQGKQAEADLTIKVDGTTVVFVSLDDFKYTTSQKTESHQRNTRSVYQSSGSIVDEIIEYLKRQPVSFNRGFNFNIQERIAKVLDIDVNVLAGMRFESRAQGHSGKDFEIVAQMEPRFAFEAITGPAKVSAKKLLQRFSTKSALGLRLRFKEQELVDLELTLPMNTMELFTFETQIVEKNARRSHDDQLVESYSYLPESIYGQEDIYASYPIYSSPEFASRSEKFVAKRSIVPSSFIGGNNKKSSNNYYSQLLKTISSKAAFSHSYETSRRVARATGLIGKLRVVASPKDMSLLVAAVIEKHEPQMRGFRVKIEQQQQRTASDLKAYTITMMTPGSQIDRTMQVRLTKQTTSARTLVKSEIQSPVMGAVSFSTELVHDAGRQYSVKSELVSRSGKQWRHLAEFGLVQGPSSSTSGRLAHFNYKPFLQIDSSALKRPIAMQGQIAYVQSPKAVISYELKCPTSGDFIQGKLIFDQRDNKMSSSQMRKRSSTSFRRSMQSPLELIASQDLTLTSEFVAQFAGKHGIKSHQMIDWDCQKLAVEANSQISHKNLRKQTVQQLVANMKLDGEQQVFTIERKCAQEPRKQWTVRVVSQVRPTGHQMDAECRYNGRRGQQEIAVYKHKMDIVKVGQNKFECTAELELAESSRQFNEKLSGRARFVNERKQKQCQIELSGSRAKQAKLSVDFESLAKHQIQLTIASERFAHKCEMRNDERQFVIQSRTEKPNTREQLVKLLVEVDKQIAPLAAKIAVEVPKKRVSVAAELKLTSGQRSSFALQTGRFVSQAEFTFDLKDLTDSRRNIAAFYPFKRAANLRFRSNLKDLANKQAYWMDSQLNGADWDQESFLRLDSPYYRTELEFSPREQQAKLAAFARSARAQNQFDTIYQYGDEINSNNNKNQKSLIEQVGSFAQEKLALGPSKMWMVRSLIKSPFARDQLKKEARRALFEYADRRQSHKHSLEWSPEQERVNMELVREPNSEFVDSSSFEPLRMKAALSTEMSRPSTVSLESEWMSADVEAKPFGHFANDNEQESYAKVSALSRHPRSTFKKHDSEIRYSKQSGYKAHMKHVDAKDKRHQMSLEADRQPQKWTKFAYEADKHGKTNWEHKWRQQQQKRSLDQEDVYQNKMYLSREGPAAGQKWQHETKFDWEEPSRMSERRFRRSIFANTDSQKSGYFASLYQPIEYLKNTQARLQSTYTPDMDMPIAKANSYKLDFDYKPLANVASMAYEMPEEMSHFSQVEIKPAERVYKLQSKLYNRRTQEPTYELLAATKSAEMTGSEQEPIFVHSSHPSLERPISRDSLVYQLFKQPMKLDYSDKYGRVANFDYDQLVAGVEDAARQQQQQKEIAGGLRQKRAILSFKDPMADIEHSSTYDFYPETYMTKINKHSESLMAPIALKTLTKYGPIVVRADSTDSSVLFDLESPIGAAKIIGETGANLRTLYKVQLDNKSQRVQLAKILREAPEFVRENKLAKKFARKFDSNKWEQQAELLVSIVDQIFKVKTTTKVNGERPVCVIEGEWNEQTGKAYAKINGERVEGQAVVDLVRKTADLTLEVDNKRTLNHYTRLVKTSDKFYSLESMTYHKSRPLFKLTGQVSAKVFDLEHLIYEHSRRSSSSSFDAREHLSTFEAVVYEPKELHVIGQFDCDKKEARIVIKNLEEQRTQESLVRFDTETETIYVSAELNSKHEGQIYKTQAKINLPGLYQSDKCSQKTYAKQTYGRSNKYAMNNKFATATTYGQQQQQQQACQSEIVYSDNKTSGIYAAQYYPGQFVQVQTPRAGKTTFNLAY